VTQTAAALLRPAAETLEAAGVEDAAREARLLLALATGVAAGMLVVDPGRIVSDEDADAFTGMLARRAAREPFSQIAGVREFWSRDFIVTPDVLTPRPDSETLIETALAMKPDRAAALRVLDLGTGSGCLLLTILAEYPNATGVGVDLSANALAVAAENASRLGLAARVDFVTGGWDAAPPDPFDLVLCNPPYIRSADIESLAPEVRQYDPVLALDGGGDGLENYRALAPVLKRVLSPADGLALVEVGAAQDVDVKEIFEDAGLSVPAVRNDLAGIGRCVVATPG
jgi:release factor glutamine methyltransferase